MAESTTTPPDDVVHEILLLLDDVATLFRCAVTCKSWRRLVAMPSFLLRHQWPPSLVVGFFTKLCPDTETIPTDSSGQLTFVPLPGPSLLGNRPRALSSFIHADDAADVTAVDRAMPLATRGGLLLVRLYTEDDDLGRLPFNLARARDPVVRVSLAVCNPLAGTWDVLPELICRTRFPSGDRCGCVIIPSVAGGTGSSPAFKVLMIGEDRERPQFNLHTFVSGEASWRAPTKCFDMEREILSMEHTNGVLCGGYAHWLFVSESNHFHVLNVDVETGHVSLTKLLNPTKDAFWQVDPNDYDAAMAHNRRVQHDLMDGNRLVTTSNGTCLSLCTYRGRRLEIWSRHQDSKSGDGDAYWHQAEYDNKLTELIQQLHYPSCIWSGERSGTLLITARSQSSVSSHIAHLGTGTLEEATDLLGDHVGYGIIPMEIDWPTYFMLRLGGSL